MKIVFLFSGQGSQYFQMGSKLFQTNHVFRKQMTEMDEVVESVHGISVIRELYSTEHRLFDPFLSLKLTHPAIFMTEYSLARMLEAEGIVPDHVLGCSLGEVAAAAVAGVLSPADALRLILQQTDIIESSCGEGKMVAVLQDTDIYHRHPEIYNNSAIAAINGPAQFVISGESRQMNTVKAFMKENDILHQELMVFYGFHSAAIDPAEKDYMTCLEKQDFRSPAIPFLSAVTATRLHSFPPGYFWDVTRKPALYAKAIKELEGSAGMEEMLMYIDLGPAGSLANLIKYNVREDSRSRGFQIMSPFQQEPKKLDEIKKFLGEHKRSPVAGKALNKQRLLACLFPGQGSQKKGMGAELFARFPALTDEASEILGYSVSELCVEDPRRELNLTQFTQPALYVVNALSYLKWKEEEGIAPDFMAGHSLGEYNALLAAESISFETGLRLVQKRGALMARMGDGGMAAVKGLSAEEIRWVIDRNGLDRLDLANYNSHNQIVLSGPRDLIARSGPFFESAGATLYFPLNVSGAFHSRYMQPVREEFAEFLQAFEFHPLKVPVVSNAAASLYPDDNIRGLLADQLIKPVRWAESLAFLMGQGAIEFKETGPGDVLTRLLTNVQKSMKAAV
jgi:trans-AT polyketide synthase/acyltransferase/oxidoreductase domain-containing protein